MLGTGIRRATAFGITTTVVLGLIALAVVGAGGIVAWEYSNSNAFCANVCHSVHPEESRAHATSFHARVQCVECHMGRLSTLQLMALKPTHAKELWGMIVGYERPLHSSTLRPARDNCENCHWPSVIHRDRIQLVKRYATDEASSETAYRLVLHTGFGAIRPQGARGIHWHIDNEVTFIATDPQKREIPWVQVRGKDGTVTTYVDAESRLSADELKKLTPQRMECYDCHNQTGHPFPNPEDLVDAALAEGRIDRALPFAKKRAVDLIARANGMTGPLKELEPKFERMIAESVPKGDLSAQQRALEKKFAAAMLPILANSSFSHEGLSWKSFPDHAGHKDTAGCFRCHNGKHLSDKGESIRLQCTLCHDLPQVTREKGKGSVPSVVMAGLTPPDSHEEPNFMHDHRFRLDDSCAMCHGKIEFGREGGSFCSNPACHGRKWPQVNLSAKRPS
jgi:hypothetical protein